MAEPATDYDLVVIGAGINGAAIARDAAMRGLSVLLLDKSDFGSGTSSYSSRLIHGGLRYLEFAEFPLVFESLRERRLLQVLAPHLVRRLRLAIPVYRNSKRGLWLVRLGMIVYDLLSIGKAVPRHRMLDRAAMLAAMPGLNPDGLLGGAQYYDAQVCYAERLVLENVIDAAAAGAVVKNYSPVIGMNVKNNRLQSIHYVDCETGEETQVAATVVVNAAGPWVDRVLETVNRVMPRHMGGTKGSHIVVPVFAGAPEDAVYAEAAADGRPFFVIPWNGQFLIGTTDIRYTGDPEDVTAGDEEIDYLLSETNRLFPQAGLSRRDIHYAYTGVRPLPRHESGPESAISRKHIIKKHRVLARGLVSVIGGKLTTYRNLAEQTVNYVNKKTGMKGTACRTRSRPLPGASGIDTAGRALERIATLSAAGRRRLLGIYGGRAKQIVALAESAAELAVPLDVEKSVIAAEVAYVIAREYPVTLTDIVYRRMMLGLLPNQGVHLIDPLAAVAAVHLQWSNRERNSQIQALHQYNKRFRVKLREED